LQKVIYDYQEYYVDKYIEEVKPKETRDILTHGLTWHILTEGSWDSEPMGMIGYQIVTDGHENKLYIEFIYIDPKYRRRPNLWFSKIVQFCRKWKFKTVEISASQKTKRWVEKLANKKPYVLIYDVDVSRLEKKYGW
tara:strand:- start:3069 stop:3479 length:411 start_codon:yes stop_codon:yes gene_type:complete